MPIVYSSILEEHRAVRTAVGMFDLSHMGQFIASGDRAADWLDSLTSNEVGSMHPNQARYNVFTNERGGARDDVIIYRLAGRWLIVVNAGNTPKIWQLLTSQQTPGVSLTNRTAESALIALQGPRAAEFLQPHLDIPLDKLRYYYSTEGQVRGVPAQIARTGYTGEDGFELFVRAGDAGGLWNFFLDNGQQVGLMPAGLGARDVLRLEAGMPLYGHELDEDITPLMARLDWVVKFGKPEFTGKTALDAQRAAGNYDRIAGLIMEGKAPARSGYQVFRNGERVGEIRSGSPAPALSGKNIATALLHPEAAAPDTKVEVEIRGSRHAATVVELPFYRRQKRG